MASVHPIRCEPRRPALRDDSADHELRALMVAYQQGDSQAFEALYVKLRPMVRRFVATLTHDPAWLDDLVQETFLQLHRARQTYSRTYPVHPWVFAIARHVFLMSRRSRARRHDFDHHHEADLEMLVVQGHEDAFVARSSLEHALSVLTPDTRRAVVLRHGLGLDYDEVGRIIGVANAAARLRVCRAMARMRTRRTSRRADSPTHFGECGKN